MRKVWDVVRIEATRRNNEARGSLASVPREAAVGWTIQDAREMCATVSVVRGCRKRREADEGAGARVASVTNVPGRGVCGSQRRAWPTSEWQTGLEPPPRDVFVFYLRRDA